MTNFHSDAKLAEAERVAEAKRTAQSDLSGYHSMFKRNNGVETPGSVPRNNKKDEHVSMGNGSYGCQI